MNPPISASTAPGNGASTLHDLFALTDEQILEIEPEAQDVEVSSSQAPETGNEPTRVAPRVESGRGPATSVQQNENRPQDSPAQAPRTETAAQPRVAAPQEPPAWLAAQMKDPWAGEEAKELWNGILQAKKEAADYRAAFATPEDARALKDLYPGGVNEARAAAERARTLDEIDRAYFGTAGNSAEQTSASRAQLAAKMLREDPAAFREMVFAGLRALEETNVAPPFRAASSIVEDQPKQKDAGLPARPGQVPLDITQTPPGERTTAQEAHVAAYAAFEKAANDDLERSVAATIERTLEQALPNAGRADGGPLKGRLATTIRQDVEAALKGDRQLGEQVAQILSGRRLDSETRAQVVRLIGERAQQLVPTAAKRVLSDWTQTTMAAHRGRSERADAASARREVAPASPESRRASAPLGPARATSREPGPDPSRAANKSRTVDYRKLSDEQILEM